MEYNEHHDTDEAFRLNREAVRRLSGRHITIVCTANICRSPMAEWVLRKLTSHLSPHLSICSRGVRSVPGRMMDPVCAELLRENGYPVQGETLSAQLTRTDMATSDLVLVMENGHRRELLLRYPEISGKVWLLGHWSGGEIPDPFGWPRVRRAVTLERIERACVSWLEPLNRIAL